MEEEKSKSSFRASLKKKLRRSFRMRKGSTTSQNSNEDPETTTQAATTSSSSWYHYQQQEEQDLYVGFEDHEDNDVDEDLDEMDVLKFQLEPHVKETLRESWRHLQNRIESLGVVTFLSLFDTTQPETLLDTFLPPADVEALKHREKDKLFLENLRVHPLRIMSVIEKTMHRLEDHQRCLKMLKLYGRRHQRYGIPADMFNYMAKSFTAAAVQPTLTEVEAWNPEVADAWESLFQLIAFGMQRAYPVTEASRAVASVDESKDDKE